MPRPIVVAPDSFKGTFAAAVVADAIARGIEQEGVEAVRLPIADGGEGTMDALVSVLGGEVRETTASDPLGRARDARFAILPDGRTAIVETAEASGLSLVAEDERDARAASTRGTGELIVAAVAAGAEHVVVTVGGSATTDGGAGALEALDAAGVVPRLTVVCDVSVAFEDAPRVFGPQKGADPAMVAELEARLDEIARRAPRDPRGVAMTGCAGGLSGGLWAFREADLVPGAAYVLDALRFDAAAGGAALVITGEGALDEQTFAGKAVGEVAARCARLGVRCEAVVGRSRLSDARARDLGVAGVHEASTLDELRAAGARLARLAERVGAQS
ncbi:MAG: glycerate 2-kinase [Solirubrobacteraceae bacterium]|jgi:glycerate kinase|nr:glycerate 2-kinase [Solirubrobacteraceae bacterium]